MPRRVKYRRINQFGEGNLYPIDTLLSPTVGTSLWETCPSLVLDADPSIGVQYGQDYNAVTVATNTIPGWVATIATSGSVTLDATAASGVVKIDPGAVTANQGVNWQLNNVPFAVAVNKPVWFEARLKFTGLTSLNLQSFIGLATTQTALIAAGAVGADDKIGFSGVTTLGTLVSNCTSATVSTTGTGVTFANATWYKLGFYAQTTGVDFWVNGVKVLTTTTNIPLTNLTPSIVMQANGTVQPVMNLDYVNVVGIR